MAISDPIVHPIYAIGGCREISMEGRVIGTFTAQRGELGDPIYFSFKIA